MTMRIVKIVMLWFVCTQYLQGQAAKHPTPTPYPGPPPADSLDLCAGDGPYGFQYRRCTSAELDDVLARSKHTWDLLPEGVRQDCKSYREPQLFHCLFDEEMVWFAAHPGMPKESMPDWVKTFYLTAAER